MGEAVDAVEHEGLATARWQRINGGAKARQQVAVDGVLLRCAGVDQCLGHWALLRCVSQRFPSGQCLTAGGIDEEMPGGLKQEPTRRGDVRVRGMPEHALHTGLDQVSSRVRISGLAPQPAFQFAVDGQQLCDERRSHTHTMSE